VLGAKVRATFRCRNRGLGVAVQAPATAHRTHCPSCFLSRHVDDAPGDRSAGCDAAMEPVAISSRRDREWALMHRCRGCGTVHLNRIAGDDNPLVLMQLAVRPLARPPFPLDRLGLL